MIANRVEDFLSDQDLTALIEAIIDRGCFGMSQKIWAVKVTRAHCTGHDPNAGLALVVARSADIAHTEFATPMIRKKSRPLLE